MEDPRSTREQILDEARALFANQGFEGTSLNDIAAAVGVKRPSLLHYFGSKDEVSRRSVQLHRDQFFAANADDRRAPGYFSVCNHPGYVRATTWAAIDPTLSVAEQRFPVMDMLLSQRLASEVGQHQELATRIAVLVVVTAQLAWALFGDLFEAALDAELVRLETLVAGLCRHLLLFGLTLCCFGVSWLGATVLLDYDGKTLVGTRMRSLVTCARANAIRQALMLSTKNFITTREIRRFVL